MSRKRGHNNSNFSGENAKKKRSIKLQPGDDMSTTTAISSLRSEYYNENYSRCGKILKIQLRNFMCHTNLAIDFNQRINLLVGNNGSGKSAILTALIIGLGSKASSTNRSKNISQLIKKGESSANIEIHISNDAPDGYEKDKYGDHIIVIRNITASGVSTYKLKNEFGEIVSKSKTDLMKMMLYMNIQVDNPVCVLNQDASRTFLKESDPKKRYNLFLKATQIETIIEKLNDCTPSFNRAKSQLQYQKDLSVVLDKNIKEMTVKRNKLQSVENLSQKINHLKQEQQWLLVIKQKALCVDIQNTMDEYMEKYNELKQRIDGKDGNDNQMLNDKRKLEDELGILKNNLKPNMDRCAELRNKYIATNEIYQMECRTAQKNEEKKKRILNDVRQLEVDISERSESYTSRVTKQRQTNELKLTQLKQKREEVQAMASSAKRDSEMLDNTKLQIGIEFDNLRQKRRAVLGEHDKTSNLLLKCDTSGKDSLLVYGNYMPNLVANIQNLYNKGAFSELPRGPIGQYVEVNDERWKSHIEGIIGISKMQAFCVNNAKDRNILTKLIKQKFPDASRIPIITSKFINKVYDVRKGQTKEVKNTFLAMNLIKVSDPVVMNCLIDHCRLETILLTEDEKLAEHLTAEAENVPRNLLKIVLRSNSEYYPAPSYRIYSSALHRVRFLQVNMTQRKIQLEEELNQLKVKQNELDCILTEHQTKLQQMSRTLTEKRELQYKLENDLRLINSSITNIESIEYPAENEVEILNNELKELKRNLDELEPEIARGKVACVEIKKNVSEKEKEIVAIKTEIREKEQDIADKENEFKQLNERLIESNCNAQFYETKLKRMDENLVKLKKEDDDASEKLLRLIITAEKIGPRVETTSTDEELLREIKTIEREVRNICSSNEDLEVVEQLLDTKTKEYIKNESITEALSATLKILYTSRRQRFESIKKLRQHMSLRVQHMFNSIMKLRNYNGHIKIDPSNQTLELSVVPRDKHIESAVSNAKCLSGGERSYSTIAFLLSLWSCVDHPFYFLDEYDVFTDQVNRLYMTKLLLSEAEKKPRRQYTFLTPQDMSEIKATDTLTIHKLVDPERNNISASQL